MATQDYFAPFNDALSGYLKQMQVGNNQMMEMDQMARRNKLVDMQIQKYIEDMAETKRQQGLQQELFKQIQNVPRQTQQTTMIPVGQGATDADLMQAISSRVNPYAQLNPETPYGMQNQAEMEQALQQVLAGPPQIQQQMVNRPADDVYRDQGQAMLAAIAGGTKVSPEMDNFYKLLQPAFQPRAVDLGGQKAYEMKRGEYEFPKVEKPAELWSEPYDGEIGGKRVMLKRNLVTNEVKPVVSDTSTTVKVNGGGGNKSLRPTGRFSDDGKYAIYFDPNSQQEVMIEAKGTAAKPANPSAGERQRAGLLGALLMEADQIEEKFKANPNYVGLFSGRAGGLTSMFSADETFFRTQTKALRDSLLRAKSGAQINEQEYARLSELLPDYNTTAAQFSGRMKSFKNELNNILTSTANTQATGGVKPIQPAGSGGLKDDAKAELARRAAQKNGR